MVYPEPCKELRRRVSVAIHSWDCPLTFIYQRVLIMAMSHNPDLVTIHKPKAVRFTGSPQLGVPSEPLGSFPQPAIRLVRRPRRNLAYLLTLQNSLGDQTAQEQQGKLLRDL